MWHGAPTFRCLFLLVAALLICAVPDSIAEEGTSGGPEQLQALTAQYTAAFRDKQYAAGVEAATKALALAEGVYEPGNPALAQILNDLGVMYRYQERHADAIAAHERALAIRERAAQADDSPVAQSLKNLAVAHVALQQDAQALGYFQRLVRILEQHYPPHHPFLAEVIDQYAACLHRMGRHEEAAAQEQRIAQFLELKRQLEQAIEGGVQ